MEKIRIQNDLYTYVNQAKLDELVIPEDMSVMGSAMALMTGIEKLMIGEFNTMTREAAYPNDHLARACTLYRLARDTKRKSRHGIKPALKNVAILKKLGTMRGFNLNAKELLLRGIALPVGRLGQNRRAVRCGGAAFRSFAAGQSGGAQQCGEKLQQNLFHGDLLGLQNGGGGILSGDAALSAAVAAVSAMPAG